MKIYIRYLLKPYFTVAALIFPVFISIYALIEFFDKLDNVLKAKVPLYFLLEYILWRIPEILFDLWPVCLVLAGLLAFAFLARGNELIAFRSLGFSAMRLAFPYVTFALLFSLLFVIVSDSLLPESAYRSTFVWETKIGKKNPQGVILKGKLHFRGINSFFIGQLITSSVTYVRNVVYAKVDSQGQPVRIIWAKEAIFKNGRWIFKNGVVKEKKNHFIPTWFNEYSLILEFDPDTVMLVKKTPRLHSLQELWEQRSFLKQAGLPTVVTESEITYRLCYPLLSAALLLFSLPVLMGQRGRESLGKGLSLSIFFMTTGLIAFLIFKYIGDKGLVSPLLIQPLGLVFISLTGVMLFKIFRV
ncbi:permease YjgP/YjgQ family protein [Thermodesulfatator indicus DSM 15286]|uniref:Permease YjgP/YjgQ family protein n=1 Tax=Thermodesulfatator indicus (strain DSM 15286 / JCM 11887 / CIR29812) TaxID=667014 RepID=F8AC24_THEID|nr:LptF/LptG family permease [Thermodesulfatator indicus]AEH44579.1 permease YjgP/YjgQ family protein [Thermodesulfatator indicus DSM 15286]